MVRWCTEGDVVLGQTCQQPGSLCYNATTRLKVGVGCCEHLNQNCRHPVKYDASGNPEIASYDWYCQYGSGGGAEGQSCVSID